MRKINLVLLMIIITGAAFLRFYRLSEYPALNADEAAIGYNAYSLLETGKDEHGNSWPIHFQSFNDYKPGLYFYLVLPFVKLFGLSELSVRFPSAFAGVLTVLVVYLFVKELFSRGSIKNGKWRLEIMAAAMLAVSPWHIHFSRGGWEVNVATFFIVTGLWLYVKAGRNLITLLLSATIFALSFYTYHSARVVVPLIFLGLVIIYRNEIKENIGNIIIAGIIGIIILLPLGLDLAKPGVVSRVAGVGLLADVGPVERINEQRGEHANLESILAKMFHNKPVNYSLAFLENWSEHYHGEFLFMSGDEIQRNKVPETGQMYMHDFVFLLIGIAAIIMGWKDMSGSVKKGWMLIVLWVIVAPIAAAFTFQSPHALRAHNMVIPLTVISAYGLYWPLQRLDKGIFKIFWYG